MDGCVTVEKAIELLGFEKHGTPIIEKLNFPKDPWPSLLYYWLLPSCRGFTFLYLEPQSECENVKSYTIDCHGYAFYDGVRHIYFGYEEVAGDGEGYLHCPYLHKIIKLLQRISELEKQYCDRDYLDCE